MKSWTAALVLGALGVGFALGRVDLPVAPAAGAATFLRPVADRVEGDPIQGAPVPGDPREVIPLVPGPGQQPGTGQQPQPGQTPGEGDCTVLMFRDGQFYRIQPGTPAPGTGTPRGPGGTPNGDSELFPIQPQSPGPQSPAPDAPPFSGPELRT
ncbi:MULTISPECIES: hypothetical protein [Deinococcus]|uniref:Uncharacterized protein n=1 Tax=Deinococcus rufus TaxID=2136097 RepID=A0ABV7Z2L7_9DEIO|nr:hypothetical protein [Deinococcus sp. AB2017081]WQE95901.1 hypothetical protein U2P90_03165 [Deinococcus sp. AB2017081]